MDVARCENWLGELSEKELEDIGHVDDVMGFAETSAAFEVGLKRINAIIETFKDIAYIRRLIKWAVVFRFKLLYVFFLYLIYIAQIIQLQQLNLNNNILSILLQNVNTKFKIYKIIILINLFKLLHSYKLNKKLYSNNFIQCLLDLGYDILGEYNGYSGPKINTF